MVDRRCINLKRDRIEGAKAEIRFCNIMQENGFETTRLQAETTYGAAVKLINGERIVMGDVDVFLQDGSEFNAEVKMKYPNIYGSFGIEQYRVDHYQNYERLTGIKVVYVIEKWKNSKNTNEIPIQDRKWLWRSFSNLLSMNYKSYKGWTWINGEKKLAKILYFKEEWFNNMEYEWWE